MLAFFKFDNDTDPRIKIAAYLSFISAFGLAGWIAASFSFSVDVLDFSAMNFGFMLSVKELSMIFGFLIPILLGYISESRAQGVLVSLTGTAIILTAFSNTEIVIFEWLYRITGTSNFFVFNLAILAFVLSLCYNYFETSRDSLIRHSTDSQSTAVILGKITAYSVSGTAAGYFVVTVLGFINIPHMYLTVYSLLGIPLIIGGLLGTKKAKPVKSIRENIEVIIRGKFFNFYTLTFFTASLNIIMVYFGIFLLVKVFGLSLGFAALIFLIHSALTFFFRHKAADIMRSKGEDSVMKIRYGITLLLFIAAGFLPVFLNGEAVKYIIAAIVAFYGVSTLFDNSIKSFISYFATQQEQRSNLLIYTRLNKTARILIPVLAGWLWVNYEPYSVFSLGAAFSAICLLISFRIYAAYKDVGASTEQ